MKIEIKNSKSVMFPIELAQICGAYVATVYAVLWDVMNDDGIVIISNNEISKMSGIPSRSIPALLTKLETLNLITRNLNPGYATKYYVNNIFSDEIKSSKILSTHQSEHLKQTLPDHESQKPYHKPAKKLLWKSEDGNLNTGYRYYGKLSMVAITENEYSELCDKYNKKIVDDYISRIETHCKAYGKQNEYPDFASVIADWIRKDMERDKREKNFRNKGRSILNMSDKELDEYEELANLKVDIDDPNTYLADGYHFYGENQKVALSIYKYKKFCEIYGDDMVNQMINEIEKNEEYLDSVNKKRKLSSNEVERILEKKLKKI